jgi:hypothetical protein
MSHNQVRGDGIGGRVRDGAEDVAKRVESDAFVMDADRLHQIAGGDTDGVGDASTQPGPAPRRHEDQASGSVLPGLRPRRDRFTDRCHSLRPERTAARDAGLRPREGQPSPVQVEGGQRQQGAVVVAQPAVDPE